MDQQRILDDLPEVYQRLFPDFFHQPIPRETLATCHDCAMCVRPDQVLMPGQKYFNPDSKCCTFHPKLPNYLVGGLLLDTNPAMDHGRNVIREKIKKRIGISPSSVLPPKKYAMFYKFSGERAFGKNQLLLCPYYIREGGLCGIWKFREGVCSTYFCKTAAGQEGKKFWNVLRGYLIQSQDALMWHAMLNLGFEVEFIWELLTAYNNDSMDPLDLDELPPPNEVYEKIWGPWAGREEEFYKKSYELISSLSKDEFDRIGGMNPKVFYEWLKKRYQEVIAPVIPPKLRSNPEMKSMQAPDGKYIVQTEAGVFTIEPALYDVIAMFDGRRSLEDVKTMVLEKWETEFGDDLLIPMFHNRMVVPAAS